MSNGRFQVVDAPALAPGVDFVTRSTIGPFIDTRVDLSIGKIDRGRVYLSRDTVREMADELGLFDALKEQWLASETDIYNRGYAEAIQENHADRIRSAALDLADLAGQLLAYAPAAAEGAREHDAADDAGAGGLGAGDADGGLDGPVGADRPRL